MDFFAQILQDLEPYMDVIRFIVILVVSFIVFSLILRIIKGRLLKKVRTKAQRSNVTLFIDLLKYLFAFFVIIILITFYSGKLGDLGFFAGLLTVALGWALQKPISGVVAWLILVMKRPFKIGDRIIINDIKGDVNNISLNHIFLDEVGGTVEGEEKSGRTVMIPTSLIFEQEVINYTARDEYILDEIVTAVTYESNLDHAEQIINSAVSKVMHILWEGFPSRVNKDPHIRLMFRASGIDVTVRYFTLTNRRNELSTLIRKDIWRNIQKAGDVEFAYTHTELLFREKQVKK